MKPPARPFRLAVTRLEDRDVPSTIQGTAFDDADGSGTRDPGEPGLAGVTVYLDLNKDQVLDAGDVAATTDATGAYSFAGVNPPGAWVQEVLPVGDGTGRWVGTTPSRVAQPISDAGATFTIDFGQQFHAFGAYTPAGGETAAAGTATGLPVGEAYDNYGRHTNPVASSAAAGRFVSVWREYHPGGADRILARVFDAGGSPVTGEIVIEAAAVSQSGAYDDPVVAMTGDGRFAVAWDSYSAATGTTAAFARSFAADGSPLSARLQVTTVTATDTNGAFGIGMDANGNFAVLYSGGKYSKSSGWDGGITGFQRYTATGSPVGRPVQVVNASLINGNASLGMTPDGRFVVTWDEATSKGGNTVNAQRYDAGGRAAGGAVVVAAGGSVVTWQSAVAVDAGGRFVVTWAERTTSGAALHAQLFNADGTRSGSVVNLGAGAEQQVAAAFDPDGNVIFAWTDAGYPAGSEVRVRWLTAGGVLEPDYVVNTTTDGAQGRPGVAVLGGGRFVVGWQGTGADGAAGVFFQLYGPPPAGGATVAPQLYLAPADTTT